MPVSLRGIARRDRITTPTSGTDAAIERATDHHGNTRAALLAGFIHPAAWVAGLAIWPTNLDVNAGDGTVLATYADAPARAAIQATLVHAIAGIALAVVTLALARRARSGGADLAGRLILWSGLAASVTSLAQWVVDLRLALALAPAGKASSAGTAIEVINRLDGVKMLLIAALALSTSLLIRRLVPAWFVALGLVLALTITTSGIGYLFLISPLAAWALASGPALLLWVPSAGVVAGRAARRPTA
jgi:hypothetical protein